jgi:alkyldihydroxyacetonephosphate synthase
MRWVKACLTGSSCAAVGCVPDGVAFPDSAQQVPVADYARHAWPIPRGGGTSVAGHLRAAPVLSLDLTHLCALAHLDREAAGHVRRRRVRPRLEAQLRAHGYTWATIRSRSNIPPGRLDRHALVRPATCAMAASSSCSPAACWNAGRHPAIPLPASAAGIDLREMVLGSKGVWAS